MFGREKRAGPLAAMGKKVRERLPQGIKGALSKARDVRTIEGRRELLRQTRAGCLQFADNTMRAVSAGMGIADVRALFRGEPPAEEPNPRDQVFTNAFFAHVRPRYYEAAATRFTHTFGLGFFSVLTLVVEAITGVILMVFYVPTQDQAYESVVRIVTQVPFGQLVRDVHRVGAELMVFFVALHMLRVYLTGSFKHPRQFTWVTGVVLLILTLGFSFTGYLLPWDQLSYWAVTLGASTVKLAPPRGIAGDGLNLLLLGGETIGQNTLLRFYLGHVVLLPMLTVALLSVHYYRVSRLHGISLPAAEEQAADPAVRSAARERIDYLPELLMKELMWISVGIFAILAFAAFRFHAPLAVHSDPSRAPLSATAPWYLLWIQGMLKDPFVLPLLTALREHVRIDLVQFYNSRAWQGIILPTLFFVVLLGVPYIDEFWDRLWGRTSSRMGRNRKLSISLGLLTVGLLVLLTYIGTPMFGPSAPPAVQVAQAFMPDECMLPPVPLLPEDCGPVRRIGYAALPDGTYDLPQEASVPASGDPFQRLLVQIGQRIQEQAAIARETQDETGLPEGRGSLIVEDWQTNLKKITLRITWTAKYQGDTGSYEKVIYLHKDSAYD